MGFLPSSQDGKPLRISHFAYILIGFFLIHLLYLAGHGSHPYIQINRPVSYNVSADVPSIHTEFPRKIWQTARTGIAAISDDDRRAIQTWSKLNQKWRHEILTKHSAETYVRERFAHQREIEEIFLDLQDPVLLADLVRYLVLYSDGGVYADIDTKALKPIEDWVPDAYKGHANVVVGVEYDKRDSGRWVDWKLDLQLCTWALMATPGHPLLQHTVDRVVRRLRHMAFRQTSTIGGVKASHDEVANLTGPVMFTEAVFETVAHATGHKFSWLNVTKLKAPRLVGDVLILPITAFGAGQGHSEAGEAEEEGALVEHLFRGAPMGEKEGVDHEHEGEHGEDEKDDIHVKG